MKFNEMSLSSELKKSIEKLGFTQPTQIQEESIPHIVKGKDVIGESATGSGKTLAFGTGIIEHVEPRQGLQAVVITPTRELAEQIKNSLKDLTKELKIVTLYGGVSIKPQIHELGWAEVAVATPGRLLDHLQRRTVNFSKVRLLVLDEADRMFDMGFIEDIEKIIRACPKERQTLFFSATISSRVKKLAQKFMVDPISVAAKNQVDPSKLKQDYFDVQRNKKFSLLAHLLKKEQSDLIMVFCNTRRTTDFVVQNLKKNNMNAIAIHGGLAQNKRTKTINSFNTAQTEILVCTDVAARGLHIDNVSHVYNYEIPNDPTNYVHRIGRTARAGESGKVVNILCDYDYDNFSRIQFEYKDFSIQKQDLPSFDEVRTYQIQERKPFRRNNSRGGSRGFSKGGQRNGSGFRRFSNGNSRRGPRNNSGNGQRRFSNGNDLKKRK